MKNITYNRYQKFKEAFNKTYSERFSGTRNGLFIFSIFGNIASIFFAYFFFMDIFSNTHFNVSPMIIATGIIGFLTLLELIKRYVFDIFSVNIIKHKMKFFTSSKISFLFMTLALIVMSFIFSLNGAQKLVNREKSIVEDNQGAIEQKVDSINTYYLNTYINPKLKENDNLVKQRDKDLDYLNNGSWKSNTERNNINNRIASVDKRIKTNDSIINYYNVEKTTTINEIKNSENTSLLSNQLKNNVNILYFLILSTIIEIIIMIGIYYNRYYEDATVREYEQTVINTSQFKKWQISNLILDLIFNYGDIRVNDPLPAFKSIVEVIQTNDLDIPEKTLKDTMKIFTFLKISETRGNKRILKVDRENAQIIINNYYKII